MTWRLSLGCALGLGCAAGAELPENLDKTEFELSPDHLLEEPRADIWLDEPGRGFRTSAQTLSLEVGGAYGPAMMGSQEHHHLALLSLAYGHMFGTVMGGDNWWRGNFEIRFELFGGMQVSPELDWLVGITPHVRYNFAAGSRWTPFLDGGVGVSLTGIGPPDLGSLLEFNLQAGGGVHWHVQDGLALTLEAHYMHLSSAGLSDDNAGLNAIVLMLGMTKLF